MNTPAKYIDHTLLRADVTEAEICVHCEEAVEYGFAAVCIPPSYVTRAKNLLYGSEVAVCTVVGFPLGYQTSDSKVFETRQAVDQGADEIDMVIRLGAARAGEFATVKQEIRQVVTAADGARVKAIIECCLFDDEVKRRLAEIVIAGGAHFVKTSTGFAASGASVADVELLSDVVAARIGVKAAGGIRDWAGCRAMLEAGASRIGTSAGVIVLQQWRECAEQLWN